MKKTSLLPLFLSQTFRAAAVSFLTFFSSLFILKKYLSLTGDLQGALLTVFVFNLIVYLFKMAGVSGAENLALKFGLKRQVFIGHCLTGIASLAFAFSKNNFFLIWPAAVLWGLAIGFFWFGRHGLMAKISPKDSYGRMIGLSIVLETTLLLFSPLLGGVLINQFGYPVLFFSAFIFVILAIFALAPLVEEKTHRDVTLKEVFRTLLSHKKMALTYLSQGALGTFYSDAFVLFVFLMVKKEAVLGGFFSLSMILVALTKLAIGAWVDRYRGQKGALVAFGAVSSFFIWIGRFLVQAIGGLFIFDIIDRIIGGMVGIPLDVLTYEKAIDGESTGRAILFREFAITFGSILATIFLLILVLLGINLKLSFLPAAILSLFPLLIVGRKKEPGAE